MTGLAIGSSMLGVSVAALVALIHVLYRSKKASRALALVEDVLVWGALLLVVQMVLGAIFGE